VPIIEKNGELRGVMLTPREARLVAECGQNARGVLAAVRLDMSFATRLNTECENGIAELEGAAAELAAQIIRGWRLPSARGAEAAREEFFRQTVGWMKIFAREGAWRRHLDVYPEVWFALAFMNLFLKEKGEDDPVTRVYWGLLVEHVEADMLAVAATQLAHPPLENPGAEPITPRRRVA